MFYDDRHTVLRGTSLSGVSTGFVVGGGTVAVGALGARRAMLFRDYDVGGLRARNDGTVERARRQVIVRIESHRRGLRRQRWIGFQRWWSTGRFCRIFLSSHGWAWLGKTRSAFGSHVAQTLLTLAAASLANLSDEHRGQLEESLQRVCRVVAQRADEVMYSAPASHALRSLLALLSGRDLDSVSREESSGPTPSFTLPLSVSGVYRRRCHRPREGKGRFEARFQDVVMEQRLEKPTGDFGRHNLWNTYWASNRPTLRGITVTVLGYALITVERERT